MNVWARTWPLVKGWYWFYGRDGRTGDAPQLVPVRIQLDAMGHPVYIAASGVLLYSTVARGLWMPMEIPKTPPLDDTFYPEHSARKLTTIQEMRDFIESKD